MYIKLSWALSACEGHTWSARNERVSIWWLRALYKSFVYNVCPGCFCFHFYFKIEAIILCGKLHFPGHNTLSRFVWRCWHAAWLSTLSHKDDFSRYQKVNSCPAELSPQIFHSLESGIADATSSFKWRKICPDFRKDRLNYFTKVLCATQINHSGIVSVFIPTCRCTDTPGPGDQRVNPSLAGEPWDEGEEREGDEMKREKTPLA